MTTRTYHIGTMGWSYDDWRGPFYPPKAQARDYLAAYAEHFGVVEVDSSFYGMPRPEIIRRWCKVTPDEFRFTLKCPQEITHERGLVGIEDVLPAYGEMLSLFEDKLGMFLFQFPPSFRAREIVRVKRLFDLLATGNLSRLPVAVEFRHPSWLAAGAPALAAEYGVTWAVTDLLPELHETSERFYLRLIGDNSRDIPFDRVVFDVEAPTVDWAGRLRELSPKVREVYAFINNHYSGHSPATASRLRQLLGLDAVMIRRQGTLFD